jgi:hypothetical protein
VPPTARRPSGRRTCPIPQPSWRPPIPAADQYSCDRAAPDGRPRRRARDRHGYARTRSVSRRTRLHAAARCGSRGGSSASKG